MRFGAVPGALETARSPPANTTVAMAKASRSARNRPRTWRWSGAPPSWTGNAANNPVASVPLRGHLSRCAHRPVGMDRHTHRAAALMGAERNVSARKAMTVSTANAAPPVTSSSTGRPPPTSSGITTCRTSAAAARVLASAAQLACVLAGSWPQEHVSTRRRSGQGWRATLPARRHTLRIWQEAREGRPAQCLTPRIEQGARCQWRTAVAAG